MPNLRASLPPVNSLVAFEAVARHLSFTRAGEELRVSREAVSRQVRNLEGYLGVKLFVRLHRALELTKAGDEFQAVVQQSLGEIAKSASAMRGIGKPPKVTITATIAIASFWLTPRLPKFLSLHPGTEIRVVVSDPLVDMAAERIDIGLRYGDGAWPNLAATRLFGIDSFPVCTPGYLAEKSPIERPADLVEHTLLNLDGVHHAVEDWAWWLEGAGVPRPASLNLLGFDSYANVIQAALDGQGLALGFSYIIGNLLKKGSLVRPIDQALSKGNSVFVVTPRGATLSPSTKAFRNWVVAEAAAETRDAGPI